MSVEYILLYIHVHVAHSKYLSALHCTCVINNIFHLYIPPQLAGVLYIPCISMYVYIISTVFPVFPGGG